jgi:hypothetical protein
MAVRSEAPAGEGHADVPGGLEIRVAEGIGERGHAEAGLNRTLMLSIVEEEV